MKLKWWEIPFLLWFQKLSWVSWVDMSSKTKRHMYLYYKYIFFDCCHSTAPCLNSTGFSQWHGLYQVLVSSLFSLNWMIFTIRIPKKPVHIITNVSEYPWVTAHLLRLVASGYLSSWHISHMKIYAPIPCAFLETLFCLALLVTNFTSHLVALWK